MVHSRAGKGSLWLHAYRIRPGRAPAALAAAILLTSALTAGSASADGPTMTGRVVAPDGKAVESALVSLHINTLAGTTPIPDELTTTDANGNYSLPQPGGAAALSVAKANGGMLNYAIFALGVSGPGVGVTTKGLPLTASSSSFVAMSASSLPLGQSSPLTASSIIRASPTLRLMPSIPRAVSAADLASNPVPQTARLAEPRQAGGQFVSMTQARTLPENLVIARSVQVAPDVACGTGFVPTSYETDFEPVTELHAYVDQQVRGTYSQQANSDFNAGFAPNGGGFSVNGTYHIGNSSGGGFSSPWLSPAAGHNAYGMWLETQFQYEKGNMVQACGGLTKIVGQAIFPQEWQGGGIMSVDVSEWDGFDGNGQGFAHQPQSHISPFDPGFTPYRVDHRALDYGASIGAFGIGLGGSTGFSSTVRMDWVMGRAFPKYYLFGHDGDQLTAHVVYAY